MRLGFPLFLILLVGCFLPQTHGRIEIAGYVVRQEKCLFTPKYGPCKKRYKVFAYDLMTNRCVQFYYSGCGGNPNRFATENECRTTCYVVETDKTEIYDDNYEYEDTTQANKDEDDY
ncbi:uncharacterized protein Dana_GF18766 [Drosophila ananassae]|uniref:BPTI/Kunitz inhibitor domain-containing protein n=1 Tax=Drosophila ananassae TaxID=7217 RepID=B3LY97_DROAN|nr:kunitz-type serine protease inhibitor conotoxin Cal9.1a isoform X2 [Drosophila ananassae]EDV44001.1 uncharacterized protein Dana_GF18766 [Drosophila ananassae]